MMACLLAVKPGALTSNFLYQGGEVPSGKTLHIHSCTIHIMKCYFNLVFAMSSLGKNGVVEGRIASGVAKICGL